MTLLFWAAVSASPANPLTPVAWWLIGAWVVTSMVCERLRDWAERRPMP